MSKSKVRGGYVFFLKSLSVGFSNGDLKMFSFWKPKALSYSFRKSFAVHFSELNEHSKRISSKLWLVFSRCDSLNSLLTRNWNSSYFRPAATSKAYLVVNAFLLQMVTLGNRDVTSAYVRTVVLNSYVKKTSIDSMRKYEHKPHANNKPKHQNTRMIMLGE